MSLRIAVACAALLLACADATGLGLVEKQAIRAELAWNESKWAAKGITDYRYSFRRLCYCPPPTTAAVEIEVRDDSVSRVRLLATGEHLAPATGSWPTVDDLFDRIRLALDGGATGIVARYDPVYGYPLEIAIEWSAGISEIIAFYASALMPIG